MSDVLADDPIEQEFMHRLAEKKKKKIERLGRDAVLWLALVPYWTVPLARACKYPVENLDLFIEQAQAAGLCEIGFESAPPGEEMRTFWMPSGLVSEQIDDSKNEVSVSAIRDLIIEIGSRLRKISGSWQGIELAPSVHRWMELAYEYRNGSGSAARYLTNTTQNLIKQGMTGEALAWTGTASLLAQTLGDEMENAVITATHQIQLEYRRLQDQRYLEGFLEIRDQVEAFEQLISAKGHEPWALHYIGMGGVGKTMLLRFLSYKFADKAAIARVDFDYLSPEYPVRQPGVLLTHFATELKLYFTSRHELAQFDELFDKVDSLHAELSAGKFSGNWRDTLESPIFREIITTLCSIFDLLFSRLGKMPVLILDTCEELVKLEPSNGEMPNLEATFRILKSLHDLVPSLRVVFAGRRPLALSGAGGWSVNPTLRSYLPEKMDFLRLHLLRGFTLEQARTYLNKNKKLVLGPELEAAVLEKSFETGDPGDINIPHVSVEKRYNPFDLSLYAGWLKEDRTLTPDKIRRGGADPYIKLRIIGRIQDPHVRRLLPAVALLGTFTADMLRPLLHLSDADYQDVFWRLSEQEWINPVRSEDGRRREIMQVEINLQPRLKKFFEGPEWRNMKEEARRLLGPHLDRLVRERPFSALSVIQVGPALSLQDPMEAALLWEHVDREIATDANWNWGLTVAGQLMGLEDPDSELRHPLYAALKSTQIAAQLHLTDGYDAYLDWEVVESTLSTYPDLAGRKRYASLALAGKLYSLRWRDRPLALEWIDSFLQLLDETLSALNDPISQDEQLVAALVSGVDSLLDWFEVRGKEQATAIENLFRTGWHERFAQWAFHASGLPDEIRAFALVQAGRALHINRQEESAQDAFQMAEKLSIPLSAESSRQVWSFWHTPRYLVDRVRLEWLRQSGNDLVAQGSSQLIQWLEEALPRRSTIDADRLLSAILQMLSEEGRKIASRLVEEVEKFPAYRPDLRQECCAHRFFPPLWVGHALCLLRAGRQAEAYQLLEQNVQKARESSDLFAELTGQRALLKVIRRARRYGRGETGLVPLVGSAEKEDIQAAWPAQVLTMPPNPSAIPQPKPGDPLARLFVWWSCTTATAYEKDVQFYQDVRRLLASISNEMLLGNADQILLALLEYEVQFELRKVLPERGSSLPDYENLVRTLARCASAISPFEKNEFMSILLRVAAENPALGAADPLEKGLSDLIGRFDILLGPKSAPSLALSSFLQVDHLAAASALETGELFSLRDPVAGIRLLDFAARRYETSGDPLGAWSAWVLVMLLYLRVNMVSLAQETLEKHIRSNYQQAARDGEGLPNWNSLTAMTESGEKTELDMLENATYPGMLHRLLAGMQLLVALQAAAQDESKRAVDLAVRANALFYRFSERYGGALPVEMELMVAEMQLLLGKVKASESLEPNQEIKLFADNKQAAPSSGKKEPNYLLIGLIALGIILILLIVVLVLGYRWVAGMTVQMFSVELSALPQMGIFIGFLFLLYLIPSSIVWLFRRVRSEIAVQSLVAGAVQEGDASSGGFSRKALLRVNLQRPRLRIGWPLLIYERRLSVDGKISSGEPNGYSEDLKEFPDKVVQQLSKLTSALGGWNTIPAALLIDQALAAEPWEALLQLKFHPTNGKRNPPLVFWRTVPHADRVRVPKRSWEEGQVAVFTSPSWALLVEDGWRPLRRSLQTFTDARELAADVPLMLLHLIGTPASTSSGKFIQTSRGNYAAQEQIRQDISVGQAPVESNRQVKSAPSKVAVGSFSSIRQTEKRSSRTGQARLGLEQIPVARAALIVVQGEPAEVFGRVKNDRDNMRQLRQFGADLFAAGAPIVLVLPVLPADLASIVLQQLARELAQLKQVNAEALAHGISRIQKTMIMWNPRRNTASYAESQKIPAEERMKTRLEQAFDITLFFAQGFDSIEEIFGKDLIGGYK